MLNSAHSGRHLLCTVSAAANSALFCLIIIGKKLGFFYTLFLYFFSPAQMPAIQSDLTLVLVPSSLSCEGGHVPCLSYLAGIFSANSCQVSSESTSLAQSVSLQVVIGASP